MLFIGWDPVTSAYFCFVTLTTIGFGDYTPVDSFAGTGSALIKQTGNIFILTITYMYKEF